MVNERWILVAVVILCILVVLKFIPRDKAREAWVIFLFLGVITWPAGLFSVEMGWIDYPVQLFSSANKYNRSSFMFEFFVYPVVAIQFSLKYEKLTRSIHPILYYVFFTGFFTFLEAMLEKYTELVRYDEWTWYWTFLSVMVTLFLNHRYYVWFKKKLAKAETVYE